MTRKYITLAQADQMRRDALGLAWVTPTLSVVDRLRAEGVEYWIVRDDDPRVGTESNESERAAPDPPVQAE